MKIYFQKYWKGVASICHLLNLPYELHINIMCLNLNKVIKVGAELHALVGCFALLNLQKGLSFCIIYMI